MSRPLPERLKALQQAVELSRGRSSDDVVDRAAAAVKRADQRVAFSGNHTVVALAGATGSGKSTSFNAISGTELWIDLNAGVGEIKGRVKTIFKPAARETAPGKASPLRAASPCPRPSAPSTAPTSPPTRTTA